MIKREVCVFHRIEQTFIPNMQFYIRHSHKGFDIEIGLALQGIYMYQGFIWLKVNIVAIPWSKGAVVTNEWHIDSKQYTERSWQF